MRQRRLVTRLQQQRGRRRLNAAAAGADAAVGDAAANADGAAQADAGANENGLMGDVEEFKSPDSLTRALKSGFAAGPDSLPPILLRRLMEEEDDKAKGRKDRLDSLT